MVSEAITRAALERRESRGAHFRDDCPSKVDEYGRFNIVLTKDTNGSMKVTRAPMAEMPAEMKAIIEENK